MKFKIIGSVIILVIIVIALAVARSGSNTTATDNQDYQIDNSSQQ